MTVPAQSTLFNESVANGLTTSFPYEFKIASADDITVELDGVAQTTGFTVTGIGEDVGGSIVFSVAPANGVVVLRYLDPVFNREENYPQFGDFNASVVNLDFDRLWLALQSIGLKLGLCVRAPISSASGVLPDPVANNIIGWNAEANGFQNYPPSDNALLSAALATSSGSSLVGFIQTGTGAVAGTVQARLRELSASVEGFGGGTSKTAAENQAAFNAAIAAVAAVGGGYVDLQAGTYRTKKITLKSKVILRGKGSASTELLIENGENTAVVEIENYTTLAGSDTWLVANGCPQAYGLEAIRINGNKSNQTIASNGVNFYGKRLRVDDVIITSCKGEGWHSESNQTIPGAPSTIGEDMPEGLIRGLYVWENDSHGFVFRGQHDTYIDSLFSGVNGGWGVRFESDFTAPTVYSGSCDAGFMHVYANTAGGIYIDALSTSHCATMISESNFGVGLDSSGWQLMIGQLQLYNNCRTTGTYQAIIGGSECVFGNIHSKLAASGKAHVSVTGARNRASITIAGSSTDGSAGVVGGVSVTGSNNQLDIITNGAGSAGIGVDVDANSNNLDIDVQGYSGAGGIGLRTNATGSRVGNGINGYLLNNATLWNNVATGSLNSYDLRGFGNAGQAGLSGVGSSTTDAMEDWNIRFLINGVNLTSETRQNQPVDLNTTAEQVLTFNTATLLGLGAALETEDFNLSFAYFGGNTTFAIQYIRLQGWDATTATVKVKLSTAAGSAQTGYVSLQARV